MKLHFSGWVPMLVLVVAGLLFAGCIRLQYTEVHNQTDSPVFVNRVWSNYGTLDVGCMRQLET